jgi:hypothetical protein
MHLVFVLPLRHQPELENFLQQLYDPSSPSYRHFLTVEEFTEQFGPSQEDYDAFLLFAKANGLAVSGTSRNRMNMNVTASVANIEKALHVTMGVYQHPNESRAFYAPDREPVLDLPFPVWRIAGLDNYSIPHPMYQQRVINGTASKATTGSGPGASYLGSDMRAAYYGGSLTGAGQSLGLVEYLGTDLDDLTTYFLNVGQTNTVPITLVSTDGTSTSCTAVQACDDTEQTLDMTQAIGMAPGLSGIVMYVGSTDAAILNAMATATPLNAQLSCSWGWYWPDPSVDDPYFLEYAAQGQTFLVAAGDSGAWQPYSYVYPAEDAYITSVGGTSLQTAAAAGPWSSETVWPFGGGGISPDDIPIPSWQTTTVTGCSSCSTTYRNGPDVSANADFTFYVCADQAACTANYYGGTSFAAPMWAGYLALANELAAANGNPPLGFINPALYSFGLGASYNSLFHDITSGSNGFAAGPGFDLASGWGSPNGPALINALVGTPATPGFVLFPWPTSLTVSQGNSATSTVTTTPTGGFDSVITLSAKGMPAGVTVTFNPVSIPATGTSTVTITVGPSANGGTYSIAITGISATTTEIATVSLTVPVTLVSVAVSPQSASIQMPGALQFTATGNYNDGSTKNLTSTAAWSSSNPSVATIGTSGIVTAVAVGSTNITATANGITSNTAMLTVQPPKPPASAPSFSPASGSYTTPQSVTLSDSTSGVTIYYTTDGSNPSTSSIPYTAPVPVTTTTTIRAVAVGNGYPSSPITSAYYTIQALAPTISPASGTFYSPQLVTISDITPGTSIYYTTNGSNPNTSSILYTGPFTLAWSATIKAIALSNGYSPSSITTTYYTIQSAAPNISPTSGTFNSPQVVTLSDITPGTSFYYTTNGSNPSISSTLYTGPITVSTTATIKAVAVSNGYSPSSITTAYYTIQALAPAISPRSGAFTTPQLVTLLDSTPGVSIYYTINGSNPSTSATLYTGPITVSSSTTIRAMAAGNSYAPSSVTVAFYTINLH